MVRGKCYDDRDDEEQEPKIVIVRIGERNKARVHPYSSTAYEMESSTRGDIDVPFSRPSRTN